MNASVARLREAVGASAVLWAGGAGVKIEPGRWVALSGASAVDYNVALCHGSGTVGQTREEILAGGQPALLMLADLALGEAQELVASGWVCVGSVPLVTLSLSAEAKRHDGPAEVDVRPLLPGESGAARALIAEVFGLSDDLAEVALPEVEIASPDRVVWGAFDGAGKLVSCLASVIVDDVVCIWSMATAGGARRRGNGGRLLEAALGGAKADGARHAALQSAPEAESFYAAVGFAELERWQLWSRPRWVLGRA